MKRTPLKRKAALREVSPTKRAKKKRPLGHKDLWPLVSKYIRQRDGGVCFTCGRKCDRSGYHAGHFIPSSVSGFALRYSPLNIHGQCYHCNINLGGYGAEYATRMEAKYGKATVNLLHNLKHKRFKIDWEAAVEYFSDPPIAHPLVLPFVTEI